MTLWHHLSRAQRWMLALGAMGLVAAQIDQPYPQVAVLHHLPTALFLLAFPWLARRWRLSDRSWLCVFAFLAIHTLGGRYTYTNTPYDMWFEALFGTGLNPLMGWERNHYDRLAHFAFGLLMVAPMANLLHRAAGVSFKLSVYFAVEFVLATGALYEVFEWLLSIVLAPDNVEAYNGQQGDIWDAQKDLALAFSGAILTALVLLIRGEGRIVSEGEKDAP
ncbi:MAG: DUF2238 domain-containing protein [Erythrobacter sp.]|uniref:DUF2238 domain-containing protein n=1 Tax=Erythrobacter sp. TaxID=1042 RepID=UPI00260A7BB3|nr:DUF2238 domain-containing protein [Erythrobacter sp.]MDJ0977963.1 DUF2238 domain-containing protein [Erythrobacter sp.]